MASKYFLPKKLKPFIFALKMRILLYIILSILTITTLSAQSNCRFERFEIDAFTGKQVIETRYQNASNGTIKKAWLFMAFVLNDSEYRIRLYFQSDKVIESAGIDTSDVLLFKLAGQGEIIRLKPLREYPANVRRRKSGVIVKSILSEYVISETDFIKLSLRPIEKIRYGFNKGIRTEDIEMKLKYGLDFQGKAACVISNKQVFSVVQK